MMRKLASFLERLEYQALDASKQEGFIGTCRKARRHLVRPLDLPLDRARAVRADHRGPAPRRPCARGCAHRPRKAAGQRSCLQAAAINDAVAAGFCERQIFRIDHYLGKETVQNLLALRFANMMFEPLVEQRRASITCRSPSARQSGLEGRKGFYDDTGALRDMVQNHMLQLVALTAMEPPLEFDATSIRDEKVKVLRALRAGEARRKWCAASTAPEPVGGSSVSGYLEDLGAAFGHRDLCRDQGPCRQLALAGRAVLLASRQAASPNGAAKSSCSSRKSRTTSSPSAAAKLNANRLVIRLQPEEYVRLQVMAKEPGLDRGGIVLREVNLDLSLTTAFAKARRRIAYERLLLDLIEGEQTLFVRRDEVEAQWTWVDAIRKVWADTIMEVRPYAAGNWVQMPASR